MFAEKWLVPEEDYAAKGEAWYESVVAPRMRAEDQGRIAAIDIDTGQFEMGEEELEASRKLRSRLPSARVWLRRVGSRWLHKYGAGRR